MGVKASSGSSSTDATNSWKRKSDWPIEACELGQRQEPSGRLARRAPCLGVWDYSGTFTQSAPDWQAGEEREAELELIRLALEMKKHKHKGFKSEHDLQPSVKTHGGKIKGEAGLTRLTWMRSAWDLAKQRRRAYTVSAGIRSSSMDVPIRLDVIT
ncbi:hypothetical protein EYF80_032881 [Liparis tanakae]|uniref:Uncharacterized protein n=1 Tax=Liparis tanakae TaxID=230148 RepID=A0A4Z2GU72_9TELE|nr:hypothetical protein EYF80_032881 [Liparis tanakae]